MHQLRNWLSVFTTVLIATTLVGCVGAGSDITQVNFSGRICDTAGKPIDHLAVQISLPAFYGLAGLDANMGKPADYGHFDQWATVITDADGRFQYDFHPVTFSEEVWLFPPLGAYPKDPPKPVVGMRTNLGGDEWFIVNASGDQTFAERFNDKSKERQILPDNGDKAVISLRSAMKTSPRGWSVSISSIRP
jgi:hypothetical protein